MEINNDIRTLAGKAKEGIITNDDSVFAKSTTEMLLLSQFIDKELHASLHEAIVNVCFTLNDELDEPTRKEIAGLFYEECISLCKSFLN